MDKKIKPFLLWLVLGGIFIFLTGLVIMLASRGGTNQKLTDNSTILATDHVKGAENAQNILIEYSDFQCPACSAYQGMLKKLNEELGNEVKIIYRHFPLESIHPYARLAAQASEAASLQNKFWEMHDKLFENQTAWSTVENPEEKFLQYASELSLNIEQFQKDLNSNETQNIINEHLLIAETLKLNSTPSFFLNGKAIKFNSYNQLRNAIQGNQN